MFHACTCFYTSAIHQDFGFLVSVLVVLQHQVKLNNGMKMRNVAFPDSNIKSAQIRPTSGHIWNGGNEGTWVDRSCLPDLGKKQAIAMPRVSQEQRNKPHWTFSEPQNLHILSIESSQID